MKQEEFNNFCAYQLQEQNKKLDKIVECCDIVKVVASLQLIFISLSIVLALIIYFK